MNGLAYDHVYHMGCAWSQHVKSCPMENGTYLESINPKRTHSMTTCVKKHA